MHMELKTPASEPHFIVAHDLALATVRIKAYEHVNLDLASNQAHALCAEHKSGKTELLLTLAGRMHRTHGDLRIADIDASNLRGVDRVRRISGLGFFDNVNDVERVLRVRTVTSAELGLAGRRSGRTETREYLDQWGLGEVAESNIEELTSYDYHRLGIALGMAQAPRVLVVHDIERDLTREQSLALADELCRLARERGVTIVCGVTDSDLATRFDSATRLVSANHERQAGNQRKGALGRKVA